jgi:hypothetical protein
LMQLKSLLHNPKSCRRTSTYSVPDPEKAAIF